MSAPGNEIDGNVGDPRGAHGHPGDGGIAHASLKGYLTGFVLAAILTVVPFWLVMGHVIDDAAIASAIILGLAAVQIVVHVVYFLHMDTASEHGWNMLALIFTAVLVTIVLGASIWVMYTENANMMPMASQALHHAMGR
ncbi:MAG: cytochrome o ubiquinol oxidase subunit IV [Gammaproteobacteria bacterium]|nr:cytochrome o ubiquinol oxidase subunit IV [Gammaproteobacteria bacterium]